MVSSSTTPSPLAGRQISLRRSVRRQDFGERLQAERSQVIETAHQK
ncbi:hypothetical protein [Streptomyces mirabilis]